MFLSVSNSSFWSLLPLHSELTKVKDETVRAEGEELHAADDNAANLVDHGSRGAHSPDFALERVLLF